MSHLPRILLRCCQSMVVALALCLPEVDPGFAESLHTIEANLQVAGAQELVLAQTAPPESTPSVNEELPSAPAGIEAETPDTLSDISIEDSPPTLEETTAAPPEIWVSPAPGNTEFLNQPTISSQLLLPAGAEKVQLLLAPAAESAQLFLPAATEVKWLLPAAPEVSSDPATTIATQLLLPATNTATTLPPEFTPSTATVAVTVRENTNPASPIDRSSAAPSIPEQVGRTIARTRPSNPQAEATSIQETSAPQAVAPQAEPRLLPASTAPRSPLATSPQRSFAALAPEQSISQEPVPQTATVNLALVSTPQKSTASPEKLPKTLPPQSTEPATQAPRPETEVESPVASGQIGVTTISTADRSFIGSVQSWIMAGIGIFVVLILGVARWLSRGGVDEPEIDWENLPRSKKIHTLTTANPASLISPSTPLPLVSSPLLAPVPPATEEQAAPENPQPDLTPPPKRLASSLLLDRKVNRSQKTIAPLDQPEPRSIKKSPAKEKAISPINDRPPATLKKTKETFDPSPIASNSETWIWITVGTIGLIGLAAWFIQFNALSMGN